MVALLIVPSRDTSVSAQSGSLATSASRSLRRIATLVAELRAAQVQAYMERVRSGGR